MSAQHTMYTADDIDETPEEIDDSIYDLFVELHAYAWRLGASSERATAIVRALICGAWPITSDDAPAGSRRRAQLFRAVGDAVDRIDLGIGVN